MKLKKWMSTDVCDMHPTSVCVTAVCVCYCVYECPSPFPAAALMLGPPPGSHYGCVCVCVSGWSSPVSLLLIVLYCSALAVLEGREEGVKVGRRVLQGGVSGPVEESRRRS